MYFDIDKNNTYVCLKQNKNTDDAMFSFRLETRVFCIINVNVAP